MNMIVLVLLSFNNVLNILDGVLDCNGNREFWVSWMIGFFRVGRGHHLNEDSKLNDYC